MALCTPDSFLQWGEKGFSLLEVLVFISVIGIGMWGILSVVQYNSLHSADAAIQAQALSIAEAVMEEKVESLDYASLSSVSVYPLSEHPSFQVSIVVTQPSIWEGVSNPDVKRVEVDVTSPGGGRLALVDYRTNHP